MTRDEWLKVRNTPRKLNRERYVWISKPIQIYRDPETGAEIPMVWHKGNTYRKPTDERKDE